MAAGLVGGLVGQSVGRWVGWRVDWRVGGGVSGWVDGRVGWRVGWRVGRWAGLAGGWVGGFASGSAASTRVACSLILPERRPLHIVAAPRTVTSADLLPVLSFTSEARVPFLVFARQITSIGVSVQLYIGSHSAGPDSRDARWACGYDGDCTPQQLSPTSHTPHPAHTQPTPIQRAPHPTLCIPRKVTRWVIF